MKRRHRVVLSVTSIAGAVALVGVLTTLGSATEGPLSATLDRLGAAVSAVEHDIRVRLTGSGRGRGLEWFGAYRADANRLRRPEHILLGAYDARLPGSMEGIIALERTLGTTFPLVQIFTAWGDRPEHRFPVRALTMIWTLGSVPVVTWEPWLTVFESRHASLPLREHRDLNGFSDVARGDYDFYIDQWASDAARFGRPFFLRFAHEMNDPYRYPWGPQHNSKEEFIAAWRHVVERFRKAGAHNVVWVWSPHVAYEYWDLYYPGDDYVDWTATGALNYGPIAHWSRWWTFQEIFGAKYPRLAEFGRPIMLAELGSLKVGGDRAGWYRDALVDLPSRHPAVRAVLFFNVLADQTVTMQKVDWTFQSDPAVAATVRDAVRTWIPTGSVGR